MNPSDRAIAQAFREVLIPVSDYDRVVEFTRRVVDRARELDASAGEGDQWWIVLQEGKKVGFAYCNEADALAYAKGYQGKDRTVVHVAALAAQPAGREEVGTVWIGEFGEVVKVQWHKRLAAGAHTLTAAPPIAAQREKGE